MSAVAEDKDKVNARCGGSYYEVKAVVEVTTRRTLLVVGSTTR